MVFQQSRVKKYNFDEWRAERSAKHKTKQVRNGEKAKSFFTATEICTKKLKQFRTKQKVERPIAKSSSDQEHKVNALASGADEGRDKLRGAANKLRSADFRMGKPP